jgi:hypothetical protein
MAHFCIRAHIHDKGDGSMTEYKPACQKTIHLVLEPELTTCGDRCDVGGGVGVGDSSGVLPLPPRDAEVSGRDFDWRFGRTVSVS